MSDAAPKKPKRRKAIPKSVKVKIFLRQGGRCACGCAERLASIHVGEFDHDPALELRDWDPIANDTIPPANDPAFLFHKTTLHHSDKTNHPRGPHTSIDSDKHKIAKERAWKNAGPKRRGPPMPGSRDSNFKICMTAKGRRTQRRA